MAAIARTQYKLSEFKAEEAKAYSLVAMVKDTASITSPIYNLLETGADNPDFKGAGICRSGSGSSAFSLTIEGTTYLFNTSGLPAHSAANGYRLYMAVIVETIDASGNAATGTQTGNVTRDADGNIIDNGTTYNINKTIAIDSLNARDQFAVEALNSIISKMEQDPTTLNDSAISHYCQQAYKYAAYMMTASANARGTFDDETASTSDAKKAAVGALENNTDKLLNNIIVTLERAQKKEGAEGEETYYQTIELKELSSILDKMDAANTALTALKDNVTNAMTNMQSVMTQHLGAFNEMIAKFDLINSSIMSFVQALNTNFNTVNTNVQTMKDSINAVGSKVDTANNSITTLSGTTSTINTNLNTVKSDVAVIKQNTTPR